MQFTEKSIERLQPKDVRQQFVDDEISGLTLRVQPNGKKLFAFYARICGTQIYKPLGEWPSTTVKQARASAIEEGGKAAAWKRSGCAVDENPFTVRVKRSTIPTFGELCEGYIVDHLRGKALNPQRAERSIRSLMGKHFSGWLTTPIDRITANDVLAAKNACGAHKFASNQVVEFAKRIYTWSAGAGENGQFNFWDCPNPAKNVRMYPTGMKTARRRFLQPDELVVFNRELEKEHGDFHDLLTLLLATGARKSNVYSMRWQDISFDLSTWAVPTSKNGEPYDVFLTPAALDVLERRHANRNSTTPWVFPGIRTASGHISEHAIKREWEEFRQRCQFPDLRLHDLRRSKGAWSAIGGATLQKIGALLGHKSLAATQIYARLSEQSVRDASTTADAAMQAAMKQSKPRKAVAQLGAGRS